MNDEQNYRAEHYRAGRPTGGWGTELTMLCAHLARIRPDLRAPLIAADALELHSTGKRLAALSIASCNHGLTPRQETRQTNLEKHAETIAGFYGLTAIIDDHPLGYALRVDGPGIERNGWGEGFGVA